MAALSSELERDLALLHQASFGWALTCCARDRQVAEDVLQEVYFKILDGRARFDGRSALKTFVFGVIRMTAREHRRGFLVRLFRQREDPAADDVADSRRPAPDSELGAAERRAELVRALAKLADRQREVLHLVFYEDLTIAEAASVMGVTLGTARQHYERGKHALAALLEGNGR